MISIEKIQFMITLSIFFINNRNVFVVPPHELTKNFNEGTVCSECNHLSGIRSNLIGSIVRVPIFFSLFDTDTCDNFRFVLLNFMFHITG